MEFAASPARKTSSDRVSRPISVGKCHAQTAKDRFGLEGYRAIRDRERISLGTPAQGIEEPFTWPGMVDNDDEAEKSIYRKVPSMQIARNCLTALSSCFNLYFVAYQGRIFIYRLQGGPKNSLPQQPDLQLKPRSSYAARLVGGYIDQTRPHSVNHLITGLLGDHEIVLAAYDDGDVVAYYTNAIANVVFQRAAQGGGQSNQNKAENCSSQKRRARTLQPLLHENVGKSAWGLAIHQKSRLIAVSSNLREITVFAPAIQTTPTASRTATKILEPMSDVETRVRIRLRNWRIVILLGPQANNLPNICFLDDDAGLAEKVCGIDIKGLTWIADIWKPRQPVHVISPLEYKDLGGDEPVSSQSTGWAILAFREESFMKVKTLEDLIGLPAQKCPIKPPGVRTNSPIVKIENCLQDLPGNPCPPSKTRQVSAVRRGNFTILNQMMLENVGPAIDGSFQVIINTDDNNLFPLFPGLDNVGDANLAEDTTDEEMESDALMEMFDEGEDEEDEEEEEGEEDEEDEENDDDDSDDDYDDGEQDEDDVADILDELMAATQMPFDLPAQGQTPTLLNLDTPVQAETPALVATAIQAPPTTVETPTPVQAPTPVQPTSQGQMPGNPQTTMQAPAQAPAQAQTQTPTQPAPNAQNQAAIVAATLQTIETMQNEILLPFQSAFGTLGQALDELEQAFGQFENAFAQGAGATAQSASAAQQAPLVPSALCHCPNCRSKSPRSSAPKPLDTKAVETDGRMNMIYYPNRSEVRLAPWNLQTQRAFARSARIQTNPNVTMSADPAQLEDRLAPGYYILRTYEKDFEMWRMANEKEGGKTKELAISCSNALTCQFAGDDVLTRRFFSLAKRLNMLAHIPELSLVVIGSPSGRVLLATLTRMASPATDTSGRWRWEHGLRAECVLPRITDEAIHRKIVRPMYGMAVGRISDNIPGRGPKGGKTMPLPLRYRLMLHYVTHDILSYEISRDQQTGRICVS